MQWTRLCASVSLNRHGSSATRPSTDKRFSANIFLDRWIFLGECPQSAKFRHQSCFKFVFKFVWLLWKRSLLGREKSENQAIEACRCHPASLMSVYEKTDMVSSHPYNLTDIQIQNWLDCEIDCCHTLTPNKFDSLFSRCAYPEEWHATTTSQT